jgi:recombination protein RecA
LAKTGAVKLIVIDSVAALTPRAEIEWDMWASHMWLQARMMSQWLRKIAGHMSKSNTTVIFINQLRQKIGVIYGNPETTTWWVALKFYASQRIEVRKWEKIEENKEQIGYMAKVKVVKNKIFPPFKSCEVAIMFGKWVDKWMDILDTSVLLWLIPKAGAFYTLGKDKFQWRDKASAALVANPTLMKWLESQISDRIRDVRTGKAVIIDEKAIEASDDEDELDLE